MNRFLPVYLCAFLFFSACKMDLCESSVCVNGTCNELNGACECLTGYEGDHCEELSRQKFLGTFLVSYEGCFSTSPDHQVSIEQHPEEINQIFIYDLGDYACPEGVGRVKLEAEINGNQLTIPEQMIDCGLIIYTFQGEGTMNGNILNLSFTVHYDADGIERLDSCTAKLEK